MGVITRVTDGFQRELNIEVHRILSAVNATTIVIHGHESAYPAVIEEASAGLYTNTPHPEALCAIFAINPNTGIDQRTIDLWREYDELLMPRIVAVTGLTDGESDFDDAVLLANRVLDKLFVQYLILHEDDGSPIALIDLETLKIHNYKTDEVFPADTDHETLVSEFRQEYFESKEALGEDGYRAGLLFPAIPIIAEHKVGFDVLRHYLDLVK